MSAGERTGDRTVKRQRGREQRAEERRVIRGEEEPIAILAQEVNENLVFRPFRSRAFRSRGNLTFRSRGS